MAALDLPADTSLAYATQTTLSVDDTAEILAVLRTKYPGIAGPKQRDICYATTNRQAAVRALAAEVDAILVIGAPNSSNSCRLVEVARIAGCLKAALVQRATDIDWDWIAGVKRLGVSAGASAPEVLVDEVLDACRARYAVSIEQVTVAQENIGFKLPRVLAV